MTLRRSWNLSEPQFFLKNGSGEYPPVELLWGFLEEEQGWGEERAREREVRKQESLVVSLLKMIFKGILFTKDLLKLILICLSTTSECYLS